MCQKACFTTVILQAANNQIQIAEKLNFIKCLVCKASENPGQYNNILRVEKKRNIYIYGIYVQMYK